MRKIAIIVGSQSDLSQCLQGLEYLKRFEKNIVVVGIYIRSQHRNMEAVKELLIELVNMRIDIAIVGAGWANHLTGCCDAFLRYHLRSTSFPIIGVAFDDPKNGKHTQAAILSITEVPGTQVIYQDEIAPFIGPGGFLRACQFAVETEVFLPIPLPEPKKALDLSLEEALMLLNK